MTHSRGVSFGRVVVSCSAEVAVGGTGSRNGVSAIILGSSRPGRSVSSPPNPNGSSSSPSSLEVEVDVVDADADADADLAAFGPAPR